VREITEVVDIDDPEEIEVVAAEPWKHRAYDLVRAADPGEAVVATALEDDLVADHRERAGEFLADLVERGEGLEPVLDAERELAVLQGAAWLFEDEFGADVSVRRADPDDDAGLADTAEPARPAIHIS
jgi:leucyl-tRNA synthetase